VPLGLSPVFAFDAGFSGLGGSALALLAASLLGLRHATDPDHLVAMSTLVLGADRQTSDRRARSGQAGFLGLCWGLGHATTLFLCGLPVVLFRRHLPPNLQTAAEVAIGVVIIVLALRLLWRWRQSRFRLLPSSLDSVAAPTEIGRRASLGRTPWTAFGIGLVHGVGGSAAVGLLLVGAIPGEFAAALALLLFAATTAVSMALVSWGFGYALTHESASERFRMWTPSLAILGILFGAWYTLGALGTF
jgi:hypothetical protein